jgi:hypothetical protein
MTKNIQPGPHLARSVESKNFGFEGVACSGVRSRVVGHPKT